MANETNGIEPPREAVAHKGVNGELPIVVPELEELRQYYDWAWEQKTPEGYLKVLAPIQKVVDQAISLNTSYNPKFFPNGEIGTKQLIKDLLLGYKLGHKCFYYNNMYKPGQSAIDEMVNQACDSGACKI